jgi:hypothetical protein
MKQIYVFPKYGKEISKVIDALVLNEAKSAVKYIDKKTVIKATRKLYRGKIDKRGNIEISLVIGKPNYEAREFIKKCKKSGEPFPVKKVQLKLIKK